jgi:hypothetical protein
MVGGVAEVQEDLIKLLQSKAFRNFRRISRFRFVKR